MICDIQAKLCFDKAVLWMDISSFSLVADLLCFPCYQLILHSVKSPAYFALNREQFYAFAMLTDKAISTSSVLLVPYEALHVPTYHEWMKDEVGFFFPRPRSPPNHMNDGLIRASTSKPKLPRSLCHYRKNTPCSKAGVPTRTN